MYGGLGCRASCIVLPRWPQTVSTLIVLKDNIYYAHQQSGCVNWAKGIARQVPFFGFAVSIFSHRDWELPCSGIQACLGSEAAEGMGECARGWTAPSKGAKLHAYHCWCSPLTINSPFHAAPFHELLMPITKLRALLQFGLGSHALPIEQGRCSRPQVPRNLCRCSVCSTKSVGDKRQYLFECPKFDDD